MGMMALGVLAFLLLWATSAFVAMKVHPRRWTTILASAITVPAAALLFLFFVVGNSSRSALVFRPEGITNAQMGKCLDEVFSEGNLGRLIEREGLSSKLAPSEVKPRITVTYPVDERDTFYWSVGSGNTWKWKATAYSRLANALSSEIEARLEPFGRVH